MPGGGEGRPPYVPPHRALGHIPRGFPPAVFDFFDFFYFPGPSQAFDLTHRNGRGRG